MCWHEVIDFVNCLEITRFRSKKGRSNLTDNWSELVRFQTLVGLILPTFVEYALTTPLAQLLRLVPPFAPVGRLLDAPKGKKKSDQNKVHHQEVCSNWDHIKGMPICSFHLTFLLVIMSLLCGQPNSQATQLEFHLGLSQLLRHLGSFARSFLSHCSSAASESQW